MIPAVDRSARTDPMRGTDRLFSLNDRSCARGGWPVKTQPLERPVVHVYGASQ